jgi:hypothetical protein
VGRGAERGRGSSKKCRRHCVLQLPDARPGATASAATRTSVGEDEGSVVGQAGLLHLLVLTALVHQQAAHRQPQVDALQLKHHLLRRCQNLQGGPAHRRESCVGPAMVVDTA